MKLHHVTYYRQIPTSLRQILYATRYAYKSSPKLSNANANTQVTKHDKVETGSLLFPFTSTHTSNEECTCPVPLSYYVLGVSPPSQLEEQNTEISGNLMKLQ